MSTTLTDDTSVVRIAIGGKPAARLFGLPFLVVGGYLAYQLAGGMLDLVTGRAALSEMLIGTLLLTLITAAFLIPGWLLVASRAQVEIDRTLRTVTCVRDLRITRLRETRQLSEFARVAVDLLSVSPNRRSTRSGYQVELAARNRKNILVALLDDGEEALAFGHRIGGLIGLPVEDLRAVERDLADEDDQE